MYFKRLINVYKYSKGITNIIATGKFSLWLVALLTFSKKINSIAVVHGTEVNFKNRLLDASIGLSLKKFDKIVAVSNYTKSLLKGRYQNVTVIPNGIDLNEWQRASETVNSLPGNPSIVTLGRLSERKGQKNVIKALPTLLNEFPELHYHCIGLDSLKDQYWELAKQYKVSNAITFHGAVNVEKLKSLLAVCKILVMLSVEDSFGDVEGFGIAALEANVLGIPVIGSINCGLEDAIDPGVSGLLIDPNKPDQLIDAIGQILDSYEDFSTGSKEWASVHDWSFLVKDYMGLLK